MMLPLTFNASSRSQEFMPRKKSALNSLKRCSRRASSLSVIFRKASLASAYTGGLLRKKTGEIDGEDIQQSFAVDLYGINLPPLMATKPLLDNSFWVVVVRQGAFRE